MNVQRHLQMDNATFLDWVQGRKERYELAGGRVMMMTGATMRRGLIVAKAWAYNRSGGKQFAPGPQVFVGADASICIPALSIDPPLTDVYGGIEFD